MKVGNEAGMRLPRPTSESSLLILGPTTPARERVLRFLERQGFQVEATDCQDRAVRRLAEGRFEALLLRVGAAFPTGLESLRELRRELSPEALPVIAIGDPVPRELAVLSFRLGADDYVTEPVDLPVLLARLETRRRLRAARQDLRQECREQKPVTFEQRFRLGSRIGEGQFGAVFRAARQTDGKEVAVKLLRRSLLPSRESRERFRREIETVSQLQHPNTVELLESGETSAGNPFLVMELLQGFTLEEEMAEKRRISLARCCEILHPVCEVLELAHRQGIVHRDIKPQNIFLHQGPESEVVKVLDFGIAKLVDSPEEQHLTREGIGPGTPSYMAPERFYEEPYDGAADLYAVGVMLFEMLTGELPFVSTDANPIHVAVKHMTQPPPLLRSLDPALPEEAESLVAEALSKRPEHRPDAVAMGRRLAELAARASAESSPLGNTA